MDILVVAISIGGILFFLLRAKPTRQDRSAPRQRHPKPRHDRRPDPYFERLDAILESEGSRPERRSTFDPSTAEPTPQKSTIHGTAYVVDGDTIVINKTQIRLFGIDAPELNHPFGQKAKWALVSICKGKKVRAEIGEQDVHGRTVAKCYLPDGSDLSAEMVKQGMAIDWPKYSNGVYRSLETPDARKKLWLAVARQQGRMRVWEEYEAKQLSARRQG